jgi:DNA-binding XRE family transcriptional regulator
MSNKKDRCDYRAMSTKELIEEARYAPSAELAIALAERLEDKERERRYDCEA